MMSEIPVIQAPLNKSRKDKFQLILTIPNILKNINAKCHATKNALYF